MAMKNWFSVWGGILLVALVAYMTTAADHLELVETAHETTAHDALSLSQHASQDSSFKVLRFTPTKQRGPNQDGIVQISEMEFQHQGQTVGLSGCSAPTSTPSPPRNREQEKAIDGNTATKWETSSMAALTIVCSTALNVDHFRFKTVNKVRQTCYAGNTI